MADPEHSGDEALLEVLGLPTFAIGGEHGDVDEESVTGEHDSIPLTADGVPNPTQAQITQVLEDSSLSSAYETGVAIFPSCLSVPASTMRRLTDELVFGQECKCKTPSDRTYETIKVLKKRHNGSGAGKSKDDAAAAAAGRVVEGRRVLTRLENFVSNHAVWSYLCNVYLANLVSELVGEPMVLNKEKLNLKPPGGAGFAPHLDTPSLRVALGRDGPQHFLTVMVAIDDMTVKNGCLRVARGNWSENNHVDVELPKEDGNPDGDGRAGAIKDADALRFDDIVVKGGTIAVFGGYVPHRSSPNASPFPRRAVFLTYNPAREGSFRTRYYEKMKELRDGWRERTGLAGRKAMTDDERREMEALASIPRI